MSAVLVSAPAYAGPEGSADVCDGCYVDTDGAVRSVDHAYERLVQTDDPDHLRATVQLALALGIGTTWYWLYKDRNVADWDNPSIRQRFDGQAWRYDNNNLVINYLAHPLEGAGYYVAPRANRIGVPMAAVYSFLTSFAWEYGIEFKEKVSINDILVTPGAGIPVGEFFHKLGWYLGSAADPTFAQQLLQWSLGTNVRVRRALDGESDPPDRPRDRLGFSSDFWHDFELEYVLQSARSTAPRDYALHGYGLRGQLVSMPGYLRPGTFDRGFSRADLASLGMWVDHSPHGAGLGVSADTILLGYHTQRLEGFYTATHGYAATVGASLAYRYYASRANEIREQLGVLHLPGFAFDWHARARQVALDVSVRAHPDFAGVGSLAYPEWEAANPREMGKSILRKQGYFYGWGGSGELRGRLRLGPLHLRGGVFYGSYVSQEGLDRAPELVTVETHATAEVLDYHASLLLQPPGLPVAVGVRAAVRRWRSTAGGFRDHSRVLARGMHVVLGF